MRPVERVHESYVSIRRVRVLVDHLTRIMPPDASVLDVGCGDGQLARALAERRPDLRFEGIDVLVRETAVIPVREFDGLHIPFPDDAYDVVLFVDVLHHSEQPAALLGEAVRVARQHLVIKDHDLHGWLAGPTLRFMDRVGNERYGVDLPYDYWPLERWRDEWQSLGLTCEEIIRRLGLYPWPAGWLFDRSLHFIARLALEDRRDDG